MRGQGEVIAVMARSRSVETELGALRSEIERAAKSRAAPAPSDTPPDAPASEPQAAAEPPAADFAAALDDLKRLIGDYAGSAEEIAADHPFAVAGAAFLLGFSLGRLSK